MVQKQRRLHLLQARLALCCHAHLPPSQLAFGPTMLAMTWCATRSLAERTHVAQDSQTCPVNTVPQCI
jgi:hypothetical protein